MHGELSDSLRGDLIRHLESAEAEARIVAQDLAGEHADWILDGFSSGDRPGSDEHRWYSSLPDATAEAVRSLSAYTKRIRYARSHLGKGELDAALQLIATVIAHPRVVVDRKDALVATKGRKKGRESRKPAVAIVPAGVELARRLITEGIPVTAQSLFDAFEEYTSTRRHEQWLGVETYEVWRDHEYILEQRRDPPGRRKKITFQTFQKQPHYYPSIRKEIREQVQHY